MKLNLNIIHKVSLLVCCIFISIQCHAIHVTKLSDIENLQLSTQTKQVTGPISLLAEAHYTSDLSTYQYKNFLLTILNTDNPAKVEYSITKTQNTIQSQKNIHQCPTQLPWWSEHAKEDWQTLNYDVISGNDDSYDLGKGYSLSLLSIQGAWGRVYRLSKNNDNTEATECAVKLIYTKSHEHITAENFRDRHAQELENNRTVANWDIAIKPYGIIKLDDDRFLLFLEFGKNIYTPDAETPFSSAQLPMLNNFLNDLNHMHQSGWTHGDAKFDNMLEMDNKIKLCDWYSLNNLQQAPVKEYRYIGSYLPPEAIRALYFKEHADKLTYAIIQNKDTMQINLLHPIAVERFVMGINIMQIVSPDLFDEFQNLMPKEFSPYRPDSLDFWPIYADFISRAQKSLLSLADKTPAPLKRELTLKAVRYIDLEPMNRV